MKKALISVFIVVLCFTALWTVKRFVKEKPSKKTSSAYTLQRQVRYGFTLTNKTNQLLENVRFYAFAPVNLTNVQKCTQIWASNPYQLKTDGLGNQVLCLNFEQFPPFAVKVVNIKADLLMARHPNFGKVDHAGIFLGPEKHVESDHPEVTKQAKGLKTPESIFDFVAGHIEYAGYIQNEQGALYALREKKGDCTEYMALFTALCRAGKIPARGIGGYICPQNTVLKPGAYHNWAQFYDGDAWQIADPQNHTFKQDYENYVAMRIISESSADPLMNFNRFKIVGDGVTVKMN